MKASVTRGLVGTAAALGGIAAGTSLDRSIVQLTAWRRVGAVPWATYSRQADLRNGLRWYPPLGIGVLLANIAAATAVRYDRTTSRSSKLPVQAATLFAVGHMLATAGAAPNMLGVRRGEDPETLKKALDGFTRWQAVRTALDTLMFGANLWSLAKVSRS